MNAQVELTERYCWVSSSPVTRKTALARIPPWTLPRALQCFASARRPATSFSPSPRPYGGPISCNTGLERNSGLKSGGTSTDSLPVCAFT